MTCTSASHQVAMKMLWLHFRGAVTLSIFSLWFSSCQTLLLSRHTSLHRVTCCVFVVMVRVVESSTPFCLQLYAEQRSVHVCGLHLSHVHHTRFIKSLCAVGDTDTMQCLLSVPVYIFGPNTRVPVQLGVFLLAGGIQIYSVLQGAS